MSDRLLHAFPYQRWNSTQRSAKLSFCTAEGPWNPQNQHGYLQRHVVTSSVSCSFTSFIHFLSQMQPVHSINVEHVYASTIFERSKLVTNGCKTLLSDSLMPTTENKILIENTNPAALVVSNFLRLIVQGFIKNCNIKSQFYMKTFDFFTNQNMQFNRGPELQQVGNLIFKNWQKIYSLWQSCDLAKIIFCFVFFGKTLENEVMILN